MRTKRKAVLVVFDFRKDILYHLCIYSMTFRNERTKNFWQSQKRPGILVQQGPWKLWDFSCFLGIQAITLLKLLDIGYKEQIEENIGKYRAS